MRLRANAMTGTNNSEVVATATPPPASRTAGLEQYNIEGQARVLVLSPPPLQWSQPPCPKALAADAIAICTLMWPA